MPQLPKKFIEYLKSIEAKRPKTVIEHILKYGYITSEELKEKYGYNHPPRAVRDVRELGVPIITYRVEGSDGRIIAAYKFGDPKIKSFSKHLGRTALSKNLKEKLMKKHGSICFIYQETLPERDLQIDHRIPFEVAGDQNDGEQNPDDFMLLSGSANRAKSWSCEHCDNWKMKKEKDICVRCYWANPEEYDHIALKELRRVDLMWQDDEIQDYERLKNSVSSEESIQGIIKDILKRALSKNNDM